MARVTTVKKAQQRYAQVPALDEQGNPRVVPVMKNGVQKVTKRGKPVTMRVMVEDRTRPLPPETCDFPGCTIDDGKILPGTSYKWIKPKSGPYGGRKRSRHTSHPSWNVWEYSNSLSAQIERIVYDANTAIEGAEDTDSVKEALTSAAEEIRALAEEKREGASNIEDGFGHATAMSDELNETADALEDWASSVEDADVPEMPDPSDADEDDWEECSEEDCSSTDPNPDCPECDGKGVVEPTEPTEAQMDDWHSQVEDAIAILGEIPV